jgi:flagella basal body P-ring formation protein FlgA
MMLLLCLAQWAQASTWSDEAVRCFGEAKIEWLDQAPANLPRTIWCDAGGLGYQLGGKVRLRRLQAKLSVFKLKEAGRGLQDLTRNDVVQTIVDVAAREWFHERGHFVGVSIEGQRLRAYVPKGHILRSRDLAPVPLLQRGQSVSIRVESGAISIKRQGLVEQDGVVGQDVSVKLGLRRLTGRVEADGAVVVRL